eukprot:CAMPEP_0174856116 /NCGR_PEP_ID=MMETSP1114-20130205/35116_1 /TAXON_ID=312471 /ORGANISM="Neobodo designis, Strain CCAP 1951/1" /LENGTH=212 /DNA_ID=CAMNT_0016090893 /DNA_START=52 /DNA_END=686 /DNA_ORIENTATION=+
MASMPWRLEAAFLPRFEAALERGYRAQVHDDPAAHRARLSEEQQRALMSRLRLAVLAVSPNFAVPDESAKVPGAALVARAAASEPVRSDAASPLGGDAPPDDLPPASVRGMERAPPVGPVLVGRDLGLTVNPAEAKRHRAERDLIAEAQPTLPRLLAFVHGVVPRAAAGNKKGPAADRLRGVERAVVTITDASDDRVVLREAPAQLCLLAWA